MKLIAIILAIVIVIIVVILAIFLLMGGDEAKFYGTWDVEQVGNPFYVTHTWTFYDNGSMYVYYKYSNLYGSGSTEIEEWTTWLLQDGKLYQQGTSPSQFPDPGYSYHFSNGDKTITLKEVVFNTESYTLTRKS